MKFHSRSDWGARAPEHRSSIGDVYGCTVHWHGPGLGPYDHGGCPGLVRSMQDFHMDSNGWSDIGYNFLVCRHGHMYEGRGLGTRGAHAGTSNIGGNDRWYGVQAMVGQGDTITAELFAGLVDAIAYCRRNGAGNQVNGHRDHHATECPGDELYAWAHGSPMEDDMPSAQEIAQAVWEYNIPSGQEDNPEWWAQTFLRNIERDTDAKAIFQAVWRKDRLGGTGDEDDRYPEWMLSQAQHRAGKTLTLVHELAKQSGVEVDEGELAGELLPGLLEALDPSAIAEAVAEALPEYELVPRSTKESR